MGDINILKGFVLGFFVSVCRVQSYPQTPIESYYFDITGKTGAYFSLTGPKKKMDPQHPFVEET